MYIMGEIEIKLDNFNTVLKTNESYVDTYKNKLQEALKGTTTELTTEQDDKLMKLQVSARTCKKTMNDSRSVYTRRMDEIKGMFTAQESALQSVIDEIQTKRDASAKIVLDKERKQQEYDSLLESANNQLRALYANELESDKATIAKLRGELGDAVPAFSLGRFEELAQGVRLASNYGNNVEEIAKKAKEGKHALLEPHYLKNINEWIEYCKSLPEEKEVEVPEPVAVVAPTPVTPVAVTKKGVKEKLALTVLSDEGWLSVVKMYFRDNSDIKGNTTLEKMRKHAESIANKTGELLEVGVKYEEVVKTSARVTK